MLSEPEAGSDATKQGTSAEDKSDYYLVNGTKNWFSSANCASSIEETIKCCGKYLRNTN